MRRVGAGVGVPCMENRGIPMACLGAPALVSGSGSTNVGWLLGAGVKAGEGPGAEPRP
jgi:hypothetical protein